jgi:hypothetical protein
MARPRKVYDPMTGAPDTRRSEAGAHDSTRTPGTWIDGVFVVADKAYVEAENIERTVLGWDPDRPLGRGASIRGTRLA